MIFSADWYPNGPTDVWKLGGAEVILETEYLG